MQKLNFSELENVSSVAVALSGGADSTALAHMLCTYAAARKKPLRIHALTVDHGLRPESADEASGVAKAVASWPCLTHKILRWQGIKPKTRKMEAARAARYRLMDAYCRKHGITHLALGHHADDQAETFLMRVAHGSGLDGLVGMKRLQKHEGGATWLWRPLLEITHADLAAYCRKHRITWVEDPSNTDTRYARARLRMALAEEGFVPAHMATTLARLERAGDALRSLAVNLSQSARLKAAGKAQVFAFSALAAQPFELALRVLREAVAQVGGKGGYGARLGRLEDVAAELMEAHKKTTRTIGGCVLCVDPKRDRLSIVREDEDA